MSDLPLPVKQVLRSETSAASVARMWGRIEARERTRDDRRSGRTWLVGGMLAGAAAAVVAALWWPRSDAGHRGPVALADGAALVAVAPQAPLRLQLDDGSVIALQPSAALEPLGNAEDAVVLRQAHGTIAYDIAPHGPRRWTIECGAVWIEVVGTSFQVEHDEHHVHVDVTRGVVVVRGAAVPDRVARLTAGMQLDVPVDDPAPVATVARGSAASPPQAPETVPTTTPEPVESPRPAPGAKPSAGASGAWRELAARGANAAAYAQLGRDGVAAVAKSASVDDLFALADVARLSGHADEAVDPLQRIMANEHEPRAPLAALTLGRVQLRSLGQPRLAAHALAKAVALGLPADLAEAASALLIEALAKAGDRDAARSAYAQFVERFPRSERIGELRQWLREP